MDGRGPLGRHARGSRPRGLRVAVAGQANDGSGAGAARCRGVASTAQTGCGTAPRGSRWTAVNFPAVGDAAGAAHAPGADGGSCLRFHAAAALHSRSCCLHLSMSDGTFGGFVGAIISSHGGYLLRSIGISKLTANRERMLYFNIIM